MTGPDRYLPNRGDARIRVTRYDLDLDYRLATNSLTAQAELTIEALEDLDELELDLVGLGVDKVTFPGRRVSSYRHLRGRLRVSLQSRLPAGSTAMVRVQYSGSPRPSRGPWGEVGWEELSDGVLVAGQPDGACTWFPCNDVPRDKATFRITVRAEAAYTVVASGELVSRQTGSSRTTWVFEQTAPMATYLATLQIGRYVQRDLATTPVPQVLVYPERIGQRAVDDTGRQPEMLASFEDMFGPYPFSSYALVVTDDDLEIPLEAQGLSVFGANHVDGARGSERLVAHELAHQWFGNSLTAAAWQHVWLHEGFACYAEWLWSERSGGPEAHTHARDFHRRLSSLPQDLVLRDPGPELMFDDRVYKRGALALHALRLKVGDGPFFDLLRDWTAKHRHGSVTTDVFLEHVQAHAGQQPVALLRRWLEEPGLPALRR